jgi:hypothetical protein
MSYLQLVAVGLAAVTLAGAATPRAMAQNAVAPPSDFNGDGFDDLAIGIRDEAIGSVLGAGSVQVLYGGKQGLDASSGQSWHRGISGVPGNVTEGEGFGTVVATGDFNGDGMNDLAIGAPAAPFSGASLVGSVLVLYGSATGLSAEGSQPFEPGQFSGLFLGAALAAGDFDADGFDELAVGVPGDFGTRGSVVIFPGSTDGLLFGPGVTVKLSKSQIDPPGEGGEGQFLGKALAGGDFNKDGFIDLAIGAPGGGPAEGGIVYAVFGTSDGLKPSAVMPFTQDDSLMLGEGQVDDDFGAVLVAADFDGNATSDLAIGIPGENVAGKSPGAVAVLYGFGSGLTAQNNQLWHQDVPGIGGAVEDNDFFGRRLAGADFNGDGFFDLAVGVPFENFVGHNRAGVLHVIYGSDERLGAPRGQLWHHDSPNVARAVEASEAFGAGLGAGDFDGDGFGDLAIGVPGERFAGTESAGGITVLYGAPGQLSARHNQFWYQGSDGVAGEVEQDDHFGGALSGGDADSIF